MKYKSIGRARLRELAGSPAASMWLKRLSAAFLAFAVALISSSTAIFSGVYPFGIASAAAASGFSQSMSALAGALIGSAFIPDMGGCCAVLITAMVVIRIILSRWLSSDMASSASAGRKALRAADAAQKSSLRDRIRSLWVMSGIFGGTVLRENIRVRLALSACTALFAGAWSVAVGGYGYYDLFGAVFSLLMTPVITYLFYAARERKMRFSPIREIAVYFTAAVITLSLSRISHGSALSSVILHGGEGAAFDFGVMFALAASSVAAMQFGIHRGVLTGLACGMAMQPAFAPAYAIGAAAAGFAGKISPVLGISSAGVCVSAWAVYAAGFNGLTAVFPPAAAACAVLVPLCRFGYVKLPSSLFGNAGCGGRYTPSDSRAVMAEAMYGSMKKKVGTLSDGMESISAVLGGLSQKMTRPSPAEYREITETAFDMYCGGCRQRERCREGRNPRTDALIQKMTEELVRDGAVSAGIVPSSLASSCWSMGRILDEINLTAGKRIAEMKRGDKLAVTSADYGLCGELLKQAARVEEAEGEIDVKLTSKLKRLMSYNDFGAGSVTAYGSREKHIFVSDVDLTMTRMGADDIRRLFEGAAGFDLSAPEFELNGASLSMRLKSVTRFMCRTGTYSCAARQVRVYGHKALNCSADSHECENGVQDGGVTVSDEAPGVICGDGICDFEYGGRYYMILSDGMGSGKEAAVTSGVVVSMLEKLICAGAELETALKMLNHIIRTAERECSATVDIAQIDLMTGEARFIKSGAAPSFVLRDGSIFRLQSKTVPIGIIRALDAEMIKFDIREGDTVVMVSDGAARSYEDAPWLLELMTDSETIISGDERCAAMTIVSEAALRGSEDDITAGIIRIKKSR